MQGACWPMARWTCCCGCRASDRSPRRRHRPAAAEAAVRRWTARRERRGAAPDAGGTDTEAGGRAMTNLCLRGGRVIDPANGCDEVRDLLVRDGRIVDALPHGAASE